MMDNQSIWRVALAQSALESSCDAQDFLAAENKITTPTLHPCARKYLTEPFVCDLTSYGHNIVAAVRADLQDTVRQYIDKHPTEHCFTTPNLHILDDALQAYGLRICFMAEYFLPDLHVLQAQPCAYEVKVLTPPDFAAYYVPAWGNALSDKRRETDVLSVGAFHHGELIGLAGCSADCDSMWQIGIDVLPAYRRQGVACALTSRLALEILAAGRVPFYCAAWSNIGSVRNAIKSGFRPAWVQMTAKSTAFVAEMNQ